MTSAREGRQIVLADEYDAAFAPAVSGATAAAVGAGGVVSPLKKAFYILRYLGPRIVWLRAGVYVDRFRKTHERVYRPRGVGRGSARRNRAGRHTDRTAGVRGIQAQVRRRPFSFRLGNRRRFLSTFARRTGERQPALDERLRLLTEDRCVLFFHTPSPEPVDWYASPLLGKRARMADIWCKVPDFLPEQGDARTLWEPARAAWALDLARVKARGGSAGAALSLDELYWRWVDSWMSACPPWVGFHWKCGAGKFGALPGDCARVLGVRE